MIIDCHTHLGEADGKMWKPEDLIASMDKAGIDKSIVIADSMNDDFANVEYLLDVAMYLPRLKVVADVHFSTIGTKQIDALTKLLEKGTIVGLKFYLGYQEFYASDERLTPLYQYCTEHNKPVMYHAGSLERATKGLLKYSHPLTIDEVANAFPDLKIVIAHMGNPWLMDCAAVMAKNTNVYADMSAFFDEFRPITVKDKKIFEQRLSDVHLFLGSYEKFLFGTDWPLYKQDEYLDAVRALKLTPAEEEQVMWKNAAEIFGI